MKILLLALLAVTNLIAQAPLGDYQQPEPPHCFFSFTLTATGSSTAYDNHARGCTQWVVTYGSLGFSAVSLVLQTAPDGSTAGTQGSWSTFTATSGSNPATDTTKSLVTFTGYFPWLRMTGTLTGTGQVQGLAYGWRTTFSSTSISNLPADPATSAKQDTGNTSLSSILTKLADPATSAKQPALGVAGTPSADVISVQGHSSGTPLKMQGSAASGSGTGGNPVQIAGFGSGVDGGGMATPAVCTTTGQITVSAASTATIISGVANRSVRICAISLTLAAAGTWKFDGGTGTNCGTNTAQLTSPMTLAAGTPFTFGSGVGIIFRNTTAAQDVCITVTGSSASAAGIFSYTVY